MLDKLTQRIVESFHRSAKKTIYPMKAVFRRNMNAKIDIGSKVLKLGTLILLLFGVSKMTNNENKTQQNDIPSTIIINNYINDKGGDQ